KNIFITSLEDQLAQSLGLPAKIKLKSTQSGQLLLPFANQEELNRIINKLL
ncbi:MAG: chromosome partitioning protein ParB, partial [Streptococcus dysgalactiae]|nr:chromosome partitioning protein ParB [Streptococcus dysgalactiae]